jgi:hypothetical protein
MNSRLIPGRSTDTPYHMTPRRPLLAHDTKKTAPCCSDTTSARWSPWTFTFVKLKDFALKFLIVIVFLTDYYNLRSEPV